MTLDGYVRESFSIQKYIYAILTMYELGLTSPLALDTGTAPTRPVEHVKRASVEHKREASRGMLNDVKTEGRMRRDATVRHGFKALAQYTKSDTPSVG
jgi:hypothetical protein